MKTLQIARGIAGVLSLVGVTGLVGCGAETGAPEGQIGSTSEALSRAAGSTLVAGVKYPGSCVMKDANGVEYMGLFGGFDANGSPIKDTYVLTPGTGWARGKLSSSHTTNADLSVARGQAKAIQYPDDVSSCLVVGGSSTENGAALADDAANGKFVVEKVTIDTSGFLTITHVTGNNNFAQLRRSRGELRACPSTHVIAYFGGLNDSSAKQKTIMTFDTQNEQNAWSNALNMTVERVDFGLAQDDVNFVAAGGLGTGGQLTNIDLIKTASCSTWTTPVTGSLGTAREGNAAVLIGSHQFAVTAGQNGATSLGSTTDFTVSWTTPSFTAGPAAGTALNSSAVSYLPSYLSVGNVGYVLGGLLSSGDTFATDAIQKSYWSSVNHSTDGRYAGAAEYLPTQGKIYLAAGAKVVSGTESLITTTDEITP